MSELLADGIERFVRATATPMDDVQAEMDAYADEEGFPTVGHEVGATLRLLARMVDAERVFEFGSGYGYSAYWFADALPADGEIVLTEHDPEELEMAREFMARGGYDEVARYEEGDAMDAIERYDGPFDVVLIDHQKGRYRDAYERVKPKVPEGGVLIADNAMTAGVIDFQTLLALVEGEEPEAEPNEHTRGIATYLQAVRADPDFETVTLPIGEGIAVSTRVG